MMETNLQKLPDTDDPQLEYDEEPECSCCDVDYKASLWSTDLEKIRKTADQGCQNCELVLDAVLTYIHPIPDLEEKQLSIEVVPSHQSLRVHISPQPWSGETGISLEVLRFADRLPCNQQDAVKEHDRGHVWDLKAERFLSGDTLSEDTLQLVRHWISDCTNHHHDICGKASASMLPKRVIELTNDTVFVRALPGMRATYACLSHCWGPQGPAIRLTRDTFEQFRQGVSTTKLPKTFRDVVQVCLYLGIPYVWIDALCILQDDNDDWKEAAATMAGIYENAYVTIATTHSRDSDHGLSSLQSNRKPKRLLKHHHLFTREVMPSFPRTYEDGLRADNMQEWPLLSRAWVYQERRLSQRIVHFARCQVYWECRSHFLSEDGSDGGDRANWTSDPHFSNIISYQPFDHWKGDPIADWKKTVTEFSGLRLTYESDRLPAIAALAERMMRMRSEDDAYIAGMWKNSILTDIAWYCDNSAIGRVFERPVRAAPSWSWASVRGAVRWDHGEPLRAIEVVDVSFTAAGPNNVGEVLNASITLKGPVVEAVMDKEDLSLVMSPDSDFPTLQASQNLYGEHSCVQKFVAIPNFDYHSAQPPFTKGTALTAMILYDAEGMRRGLLLQRVSHTENEYERVGLASLYYKDWRRETPKKEKELEEYIASLPLKELKIV